VTVEVVMPSYELFLTKLSVWEKGRQKEVDRQRDKRGSECTLWLTTAVQQPGHNVGSSRWIKITATWKRKASIHYRKT